MTASPYKVLWVVNIVLPAVAEDIGLTGSPFGGWLSLMTQQLAHLPDCEIAVAMRAPVNQFIKIERDGITYYAVPQRTTDQFDVSDADCKRVLQDFQPDILHAEGSEMAYTRRFMSVWQGPRLLSLQGVINGYAPYELGNLPILSMLNPLNPRRLITALALLANKKFRFMPRLKAELETVSLASDIMGRTLWDRAQAAALNPDARYHHCSRILRDIFYRKNWAGADCERHSIFIGNGASARKGAHVAMHAAALLVRHYSDLRIYIAGEDPTKLPLRSIKRHIGYPAYLRGLINELGLSDHIIFTGQLDSAEMAARMCRSHVYLLPSLIENSPNTMGEAMLLGVPVVAAYVGGVPSMARDEEEVLLYRADDPAMLAFQVRRLFDDQELTVKLTDAARVRARKTHDPKVNLQALVSAYQHIIGMERERAN
ncbi:MAG: hypothetical protein COB78_01515 [Hyphomicrobiales bacterium]|nr:MAG: hypothetical protein COB78_01515 [Hyphomicrobiales bacterium]